MKPLKIAVLTAGVAFAVIGVASPSISTTSVRAYHTAIDEANGGQIGRATATLSCLLMPLKLSVGMATLDRRFPAIQRGVQVWASRLPNVPFVFSKVSAPNIKVSFVRDIRNGADVQGEVHCERQVYWGSSGAKYRVRGTILIRDNVDGRPITSEEASAVLEHELGHVLGLEDDSNTNHLMGPFVAGSPVDGPAPEEIYTITAFRGALKDVLRQIENHQSYASRGAGGRGHRDRYRRKY